jgi:hypothetical protein
MARRTVPVLAAAAALALSATVTPAVAGPRPDRGGDAAARAAVYWATAPYQDHDRAVAAGYVPDKYCVADPKGSGALGYPHFNHAYDNSLDPERPAALFYEDDGFGGKRLIGVQWLVYDRDQKTTTDDDRPMMFGRPFVGPQPGHFKGQPVHYALHLWLWKHNPRGEFETYNPAVTCLPGTTRPKPKS